MFSKDLEQTISQSYKRARARRHEFMTVEHLFLALLDNPSAVNVLTACGANLEVLRQELKDIIEQTVPVTTSGTRSPRWDSSGCSSAPSTMSSPRARRR